MSPKAKVTKDDILREALELIRESGEAALNARALAGRLGMSTQPIFSNYESMEALGAAIKGAIYRLYKQYQTEEVDSGKYPPYKASGMSYIRFAAAEPELFRMMFMCPRTESEQTVGAESEVLTLAANASGATGAATERFHFEMWAFVHGIAVMTATGYLTLDEETISCVLSETFDALKARFERKKGEA